MGRIDRVGSLAFVVTIVGALAAPHAAAQAGPVVFGSPTFRVDPSPAGLAPGDFDGDGLLDLAVARPSIDDVLILLGQPDGLLVEGGSFAVGDQPASLVAGDFDGDGHLDLATANTVGNGASILLGSGDGSFAAHADFASIAKPSDLRAGDVDGDGDLDLALMSTSALVGSPVGILRGAGDGTFTETYDVRFGQLRAMTMADFDGDGTADVAVVDPIGDVVSVLLSVGDGTLAFHGQYPTGDAPWSIAAGDLDADGIADVVTANEVDDSVSVLLGTGGGTLASGGDLSVALAPMSVVIGDFDGDGLPDVAVAAAESGNVHVLRNEGGAQFTVLGPFQACYTPNHLVAADFDGDGALDLAAEYQTGYYGQSISKHGVGLIYGNGDGTLRGFVEAPLSTTPLEHVVVADFDGDGRDDFAATPGFPNDVVVALANGDGSFGIESVATGAHPDALVVGDLDQDGDPDLAFAHEWTDAASVLLGLGDGTFSAPSPMAVGDQPLDIVTADFDGDGRADLATANGNADTLSVLMGLGGGIFAPAVPTAIDDGPRSLATGDFDADGRPDLAAACSEAQTVAILLGQGDGSFLRAPSVPVGAVPVSIVSGDFDDDGISDLAAVLPTAGSVAVLLGTGGGSFSLTTVAVSSHPWALAAADVDGDGDLDLVCTAAEINAVGVLVNQGGGSFAFNGFYGTSYLPQELAVGDFLIDGKPDVVTVHGYGGFREGLSIVVNVSPSAWSQTGPALTGSNGVPSLYGTGPLEAGSVNKLHLVGAKPGATAALVFGLTQALLPFKGGVLVPMPQLVVPVPTGPIGAVNLPFHLPNATPPGVPLHLQVWIPDAQSLHGFAASNGLTALTQ